MELALGIVGFLAVALGAAAMWLGLGRARALAELSAARASEEAAERGRVEAAAETERLRAAERGLSAKAAELGAGVAALREQLDAAVKAHDADRDHLREKFACGSEALEEQWRLKLSEVEQVSGERLASAQRERDALKGTLEKVEAKFRDVFGALAGEALKASSAQFLALAEQKLESKRSAMDELVKPIAATLQKTDEKLAIIEAAGTELRAETGRLVRALREPHVRGRYGEIQLKRVAELAGMSAYCDFTEQDQTRDGEGEALRPDMIVKMPNQRTVVVDAKTNIAAYLESLNAASPEEAEKQLQRFARHVAEQATALSKKKYWTQYDGSPEFVVMFIPGDQFIDAALSRQPELLERAAEQGVILASPSTLIGLLRAVAVGYQEQRLAQAAEELRGLGKEFHERVAKAMEHFVGLGSALNRAVEKYNDFAGSYERRLEPVLRKFEEGGVKSGKELPAVVTVEAKARESGGQMRLAE